MWNYLIILNLLMGPPAQPKLLHHRPAPPPSPPTCTPPPPPAPSTHHKVISAATCVPSASGAPPTPVYGTTPDGTTFYVANGGTNTIELFCDAALPAEAVEFDYADLELYGPNPNATDNPTLKVYVDTVNGGVNAISYVSTTEVGECYAQSPPPVHAGSQAISVCRMAPSWQFPAGAGPMLGMPQVGPWSFGSIHFIVLLPPAPPGGQSGAAYRIVAYYEAP